MNKMKKENKLNFDILQEQLSNLEDDSRVVDNPMLYDSAIRNHLYYNEMLDSILRYSTKELNNNIFEIGFGTGTLTERLLNHDYLSFYAIEPEKRLYDYGFDKLFSLIENSGSTHKLYNTFFLNTDFLSFPEKTFSGVDENVYKFINNYFDIVTSSFVDHHIPEKDRENYYSRIFNLLKPGGSYVSGEEFIRSAENPFERELNLKEYHEHIIQDALNKGYEDTALLESIALNNGIKGTDELKTDPQTYHGYLTKAGFEVEAFLKIGPNGMDLSGVYVIKANKPGV